MASSVLALPRVPAEPSTVVERVRTGYRHEIAVVVLTQANRPAELARAVASVRAQQGVDVQLVLVLNGTVPSSSGAQPSLPPLGPADRFLALPQNVGIPAGRNLGAAAADARLLLFLDDDAELLEPTVLASVVDRFDADGELGAMAIRLVDEQGRSQRRHVPRVGAHGRPCAPDWSRTSSVPRASCAPTPSPPSTASTAPSSTRWRSPTSPGGCSTRAGRSGTPPT